MSNIIKRNSKIPTSNTKNYTTVSDDQDSIRIKVYQGERQLATENYPLGEFILEEIKKVKAGEPQIVVTFDIDNDGILLVTAKDNETKAVGNISITNTKGNLSRDQITKMVADAEKFDQDDKLYLEKVKAKNKLQAACYKVTGALKNSSFDVFKKKKIEDKIDYTLSWIVNFRELSIKDIADKEEEIAKLEVN